MVVAQAGIVGGEVLRLTRTNRCGYPQAGAAATYVTDAFVSVKTSASYKDADKKTVESANGKTCVTRTVPAELQEESVVITLCGVNLHVLSYLSSVVMVLDESGDAEGYFAQRTLDPNVAFALEVWSGTGDAAQCPDTPATDAAYLAAQGGLTTYGYHAWPAISGATLGDITIENDTANVEISGTAMFAPEWGRGPYTVRLDAGKATPTPTRLLTSFSKDRTSVHTLTKYAPPAATPDPVALTLPTPYFG